MCFDETKRKVNYKFFVRRLEKILEVKRGQTVIISFPKSRTGKGALASGGSTSLNSSGQKVETLLAQ